MIDGFVIALLVFGGIFAVLATGGALADYIIPLIPLLRDWMEQRASDMEEEQKWTRQEMLLEGRK